MNPYISLDDPISTDLEFFRKIIFYLKRFFFRVGFFLSKYKHIK